MAGAELNLELDAEAEIVRSWRLEELERAGYPRSHAGQLAGLLYVDLHKAIGLLRKGCPADVALQILV
jgi:hypothetical protein